MTKQMQSWQRKLLIKIKRMRGKAREAECRPGEKIVKMRETRQMERPVGAMQDALREVCVEQNGVLSEDTELTHLEGLKENRCISNVLFYNILVFVLMLKSIS